MTRTDLRVTLTGPGAHAELDGLALLRGSEICDHHTIVTHAAPHGTTKQLYKAVLDQSSRFVFDGRIDVNPGAQKTVASVYNKNLLLSDEAVADSNPEFKILADDVICRHGGAIGQLSAEALFYLRSRGLAEDEARRLMIYAFAAEMIERVELPALRDALKTAAFERMPEEAK